MVNRHPSGRPVLHTVKQVAEELLHSERTVRRWIANGDLRVLRFGRQIRISDDEIAAFRAKNE
ncbi:MAG: helix-turn-helix domain-containing protein [Proteobacteria bacterium]|nr:helix-turn-helix domain-containing protein [Pseudomonadota bacterium]